MLFHTNITHAFPHAKDNDHIQENDQWYYFAKAANFLLYAPEPLSTVPVFLKFSDYPS